MSVPDASDAAALLEKARHRMAALLADLQKEQLEWESAKENPVAREQGRAVMADMIRSAERLAALIDSDCSAGQRGVAPADMGDRHDE